MDGINLLDWYWDMPVVTRMYFTASFGVTAACALDITNPYALYYNYRQIWRGEVWRLVTNFLFFGDLGIDFLFHMYFLTRYCRSLEEGTFRNRPAAFLFCLLFGMAVLMCMAPWLGLVFYGSSLTFMLMYLWGKHNPGMQVALFGLVGFQAPYLPWVLLAFPLLMGNDITSDVLGIAVGHLYYFLADVYPAVAAARGWRVRTLMYTPPFLEWCFRRAPPAAGAFVLHNAPLIPPAAAPPR